MPEAVYADLSRCIGCRACELACERENKSSRISVKVLSGLAAAPVSCRQCEIPLCTAPCPKGALSCENGKLEYEAENCTGCGLCTLACPFGTAVLRAGIIERCNLCPGMETPACVATCPAGALIYTEPGSLGENIRQRRAKRMNRALEPPAPAGRRAE